MSGLFIHPVIETPSSASRSKISFVVSGKNLKSVDPAWSVPRIAPARHAVKKSSFVTHLPPLISVRLHPCHPDFPSICGNIPISTHGFVVCSVDSTNTKPGSPNSFTFFMIRPNCSSVVVSRTITAELFERPRCGLSTNQLPVFALIISSSSGENKQIVAERRTPPERTASASCIQISYTLIGRRATGSFESPITAYSKCSILSRARRNPSGPGALNPPEIFAPFGRIFDRSKYTRRPA